MNRSISIGLAGFGNIGRRLLRRLLSERDYISKRYGLEISVVFIADSKGVVYGEPVIKPDTLVKALKTSRGMISSLPGGVPGDSIIDAVERSQPDILVDTLPGNYTDAEPSYSAFMHVLKQGGIVVTSNKAPLALRFSDFSSFIRGRGLPRLFFKTCVMSGAPIVDILEYSLLVQRLKRFVGILNMTSNYILELLENGLSLDRAVAMAKDEGIAEPDPSFDLNGTDIAAKAAILYSLVFSPISIREVTILDTINEATAERITSVRKQGLKIKYVAEFTDSTKPVVKLDVVNAENPLYSISKTSNAALLELDSGQRLFIRIDYLSPEYTASALLSDVVLAGVLHR